MLKEVSRRKFLKYVGATALTAGSLRATNVFSQAKKPIPKEPIKIAAVSFLTGAAAAPFGIPGDNTYKMCADKINAEGGILGRKIELISKDEAGGVDAQVKLCRKLILEDKVDVVLGYISSASCLAVLPLSDELGGLIVAYDCGTHELMEGAKSPYQVPKFKLGFRSKAHLGIDNIGLALYIKKYYPNIKKIAGINPDYAWGRDSWLIFEVAMKKLMPQVEVVKTLWPPLGNTDYTAHISALMGAGPDIVHSSLWGGDAVTFTKQAIGMGFFKKIKMAYSRGEPYPQEVGKDYPEGQIICCAGTHYFLYTPKDKASADLQKWFVAEYHKRYGKYPTYPCYHAYQAIYAYKYAVEKAAKTVGGWPTIDEIAKAMTGITFPTPSGPLTIREDHNGIEDCLVGITKLTPKYPFPILDKTEVFPAAQVNPPVGIKTVDWINSWK
jgi:branched-chain amino acid transport system substrate-binding protein